MSADMTYVPADVLEAERSALRVETLLKGAAARRARGRQPCRAEQGQGCCYSEKCATFVEQQLPGEVLTAPDRFVQGLFVGAIIATVVMLALTYLGVLVG